MGHAPDFGGVRDAFERNFALRNEVGAAVVAWVDGDLVVNLWGGWADAARTRPWQQNTLTTVLSGTKGLTSTCGARYWPEFGQAGKEAITLAMVFEPPVRRHRTADPDDLATGHRLGLCLRAAGRRRTMVGQAPRP